MEDSFSEPRIRPGVPILDIIEEAKAPPLDHYFNMDDGYDEGAYGTVYKGTYKGGLVKVAPRLKKGSAYAIKAILNSKPDQIESANVEIAVLKRVASPSHASQTIPVPRYYGHLIASIDGQNHTCIIIEFIEGSNLRQVFNCLTERVLPMPQLLPSKDETPETTPSPAPFSSPSPKFRESFNEPHLSPDELKTLMKELLNAVKYLHSKNVAHRDIKLANIIATPTRLVLVDFGFACICDKSYEDGAECRADESVGTRAFMAPRIERAMFNPPDVYFYGDIWSLGIVFYMMSELQNPKFAVKNFKRKCKLEYPPIGGDFFTQQIIIGCLACPYNTHRISLNESLKILGVTSWKKVSPQRIITACLDLTNNE